MSDEHSGEGEKKASKLTGEQILKIVIWPVAALFFAALFFQPIAEKIKRDSTDITLGPSGIQIISKNVVQATEKQGPEGAPIPAGARERAQESARRAADNISKLQGKTLLWIDDHPSNNTYLQNAFAEAGVRVFTALDNEQAEELLSHRRFDLAITDVGRDYEGPSAGLVAIPKLQEKDVPVIIFSASWSDEHRGQEKAYGTLQITTDPSEVYAVAIATLSRNE